MSIRIQISISLSTLFSTYLIGLSYQKDGRASGLETIQVAMLRCEILVCIRVTTVPIVQEIRRDLRAQSL